MPQGRGVTRLPVACSPMHCLMTTPRQGQAPLQPPVAVSRLSVSIAGTALRHQLSLALLGLSLCNQITDDYWLCLKGLPFKFNRLQLFQKFHYHHHHAGRPFIITIIMELGHFLTRSCLTFPEISSVVPSAFSCAVFIIFGNLLPDILFTLYIQYLP